jgi:hypothetical protein
MGSLIELNETFWETRSQQGISPFSHHDEYMSNTKKSTNLNGFLD